MSKPEGMPDQSWDDLFSPDAIRRQRIEWAKNLDALDNMRAVKQYYREIRNWKMQTFDNGQMPELPEVPLRVVRLVPPDNSKKFEITTAEPLLDEQWKPSNEERKKMRNIHLKKLGLQIEEDPPVPKVVDIVYYLAAYKRWQVGPKDTMSDGDIVQWQGATLIKRRERSPWGVWVYYEEAPTS